MKTKTIQGPDFKEMCDSHLVDLEHRLRIIELRIKELPEKDSEIPQLKELQLELYKHRRIIHQMYSQ